MIEGTDLQIQTLIDSITNETEFIPGETFLPVAYQHTSREDILTLIECATSGKYSEGRFSYRFSRALAAYCEQRFVTLCNSGSSANLLAVSAFLHSNPLRKKVITCAAGFPTTANAIIQAGGEVVFVDADPKTLNACTWQVLEVLGWDGVGGVILPHTLGLPFDEAAIQKRCRDTGKWFIVDGCDAMGAEVNGHKVGHFADAVTFSFYPAHHISTGEGGAVLTNSGKTDKLVQSFNSWGRDCWCKPGEDNTCGKRFDQSFPLIPAGYDHKYIFTHLGYNLKMTDLQASLGYSQIQRVQWFVDRRRENFEHYRRELALLSEFFDTVSVLENVLPSPFGYPLIVKENTGLRLPKLVRFLEGRKIGTRRIFGGNLARQPVYQDNPSKWSAPWPLDGADQIMNNVIWVGCHPGMTPEKITYVVDSLFSFCKDL